MVLDEVLIPLIIQTNNAELMVFLQQQKSIQ